MIRPVQQATVASVAQNKKIGLTLEDLTALVQAAMRADLDPSTPVKGGVGFRGQVIRIELTGDAEAGGES